jgi:hypothetical protein
MRLRSIRLGLLGMALLALSPVAAYADHVCGVVLFPAAGTVPSRVRVLFTDQASCQGGSRTLWFCELSGSSPVCASSAAFRYQRSELMALYNSLGEAVRTQQLVFTHTTPCTTGSTTSCGFAVEFRPVVAGP